MTARGTHRWFITWWLILQSGFAENNSGKGKVIEVDQDGYERIGYDMFNVEDDDFKSYLVGIVENA